MKDQFKWNNNECIQGSFYAPAFITNKWHFARLHKVSLTTREKLSALLNSQMMFIFETHG